MWFIGKLSRDKQGAGSIVGAVFMLLILLTGFTHYIVNVNLTEDYKEILQNMNKQDQKQNKENIKFASVSITADNKLNITVKNTGSYSAHLIWLGVFNKTSTPENQQYSSLNMYINPGETVTDVGFTIIVTQGSEYIIQLVTELGSVFNYDLHSITITGPDTIPYYQTPANWRSYIIVIPSTIGASVPTYFGIYANGSSVTFDDISNPDWLHTDATGEYMVTLQSTNVTGETFILYVTSGSLVTQKRITQEPK